MGISINSHGKKSDKETQSPLLKIFKEIMMRENNDPEKRNLLDQKEDKKRKQYNGSKARIDRRSIESGSSIHRKRSPYKVVSTELRNANVVRQTQSGNFHSEKKDSWWKWASGTKAVENPDDTCSCVSCALKRIVSSEYTCIGCLILIFCISIVVACFLVFKNMPPCTMDPCPMPKKTTTPKCLSGDDSTTLTDSDRLKRKIEMINENRIKNELSEEGVFGKPHYDDIRSDPMDLPGSSEVDFGPSLRELNSLESSDSKSGDNVAFAPLDPPEKIEAHSSDKLKEFYTKLVQTDVKIKNLKKLISENSISSAYENRTPDRTKRSLKQYHPNNQQLIRRKRQAPADENIKQPNKHNSNKTKRFTNMSDDSTGFVIEKKKLVVQYKPNYLGKKLVAKCSHSPKDAHAHLQHEHQLKHPFYQNTQRLDELLDSFLNKNLPEIITDPFGLDFLFKPKKNKICKHPLPTVNVNVVSNTEKDEISKKKVEKDSLKAETKTKVDLKDDTFKLISYSNNGRSPITKSKMKGKKLKDGKHRKLSTTIIKPAPDIMKLLRPESTTVYEGNFNEHKSAMINKEKWKIVTDSPSDFEVLLSVSTIMSPKVKKDVDVTDIYLLDQPPNMRHLMQVDGEEEENLGYEDFKEVLTDEMDNHDEVDKGVDRNKRAQESQERTTAQTKSSYTNPASEFPEKAVKYNPPGVQNPNWKGPMPLYPDEINSMIKHAAMNANKPFGSAPEDKAAQSNRQRRDLTDLEYVEDYLDNKYDKLVEMAQAYSDYGVLEGKKDPGRNEKNPATENASVDHRVKLSADRGRRGLAREEKEQYGTITITPIGSETIPFSEGIRELLLTAESRLGDTGIYGMLNSHIKIDSGEINNEKDVDATSSVTQRSVVSVTDKPKPDQKRKNKEINKEEAKTEDILDLSNSYAGRTLLSTLFKGYDYKMETDFIRRDEFGGDVDLVRNNKNKRGAVPKGNEELSTQKEDADQAVVAHSVAVATNELEHYQMSQATQKNIDIYRYPYLGPVPTASFTNLAGDSPAVIIRNSGTTAKNLTDNQIINLRSKELSNSTAKSTTTKKLNGETEKSFNLSDELAEIQYNFQTFEQKQYQNNLEELKQRTNVTDKTTSVHNRTAEIEKMMAEIQKETNAEEKFNANETLVTIQRCEMKPKNIDETKYEGQILLTLENPDIGVEDIALNFDASFLTEFLDSSAPSERNEVEGHSSDITAPPTLPESLATVSGKRDRRELDLIDKVQEVVKNFNATSQYEASLNNAEFQKVFMANNTNFTSNLGANNNVTYKFNNSITDNITLSEFFMMISNWFKTLEGIKAEHSKEKAISNVGQLLQEFNSAAKQNNRYNLMKSNMTEPSFPLYDSDMIENIGHRSRVLLSVKDDINETEAQEKTETADTKITRVTSLNVSSSDSNATTAFTSTTQQANITTSEKDQHTTSNAPKKDSDTKKVKRNADDSNLIFWNDIYDDEYGIQTDKLNGVIRDKIYKKDNDFIKRSGRWVQDKFRKFTDNLKGRDQIASVKSRLPRAAKRIGEYPKYLASKLYGELKKRSPQVPEDEEPDQASVFNSLGANMVQVCKKAAIAVKQTSNTEVKEDTMKSTVATSLMQQLIRLLTDLIDYQVQARTCTKLPPDLKSFLEWLTYPEEDEGPNSEREPDPVTVTSSFKTTLPYPDEDVIDELVNAEHGAEFGTTMNSMDGLHEKEDYKGQYLEVLRAVQDLLDQYEEMSDEDKSKMTGVKFYLQNQLRYLNRQFSGYDMYNLFDKQGLPLLYKRELPPAIRNPNLRHKRKLYKFVKNFGKKHTRTTASFYDGTLATEMKKSRDEYDSSFEGHKGQERLKPNEVKNIKRNLKDVYYKAIAEAKKYATAKNGHKKQENVELSSTMSTTEHK